MNNNQSQTLNPETLRKLLSYAKYGIAVELKERQETILLEERFGNDAVPYPSAFNPLREPRKSNAVQEHNDLQEFAKQVQHLYDHIRDIEIKQKR